MNPAFASDLDRLIERYQPALWIHGHMHDPVDERVGEDETRRQPGRVRARAEAGGSTRRCASLSRRRRHECSGPSANPSPQAALGNAQEGRRGCDATRERIAPGTGHRELVVRPRALAGSARGRAGNSAGPGSGSGEIGLSSSALSRKMELVIPIFDPLEPGTNRCPWRHSLITAWSGAARCSLDRVVCIKGAV